MAAPMEFWGVEIKGNKPQKIEVYEGELIHLSHATLGDLKKSGDPVVLSVTVDGQKLNLGILSADSAPQLSFDLVFEKDFELSHNAKNGSVHLLGYKSVDDGPEDDVVFSDSSDEEEIELPSETKEKTLPSETKEKTTVPAVPNVAKAKVNDPLPKKEEKSKEEDDEDDSDEDDDSDDDEDESDDEEMVNGEADSDEDDSEEDESDEETPAKSADAKKRPLPSMKTPESKKAKVAPQKTDGKKSASTHTATPHPGKKGAAKSPANEKSPAKTPKSVGQLRCGSCKRNFNNEKALQDHSKAKHGVGK